MKNDIKILLAIIVTTVLFLTGFIFIVSRNQKDKVLSALDTSTLEVSPSFHDLGEVPINGGLINKEYEVRNKSEETLEIQKIATSCMCTQAKVISGERESRFFGMEHATDKNPPINFKIAPGESARVIVTFDPAAHGPQGTGPFNRTIRLTFSHPTGVRELEFSGTVIP